jgi:uncharacterized protein
MADPTHDADPALDPPAASALADWRAADAARLAAPRGWWAVTALAWLGDGPHRLGAASDAPLPLPERCPLHAATVWRDGDGARVVPASDAQLWRGEALVDAAGSTLHDGDALRCGDEPDAVTIVLVRRGDRLGVRVFDPRQAARRDPRGVAWFDPEPGWVVTATVEAAVAGATLPVVNLLGDVVDTPVAAWLSFDLVGARHRLVATSTADGLFVNFRDATSGVTTYGAGRFLLVDPPHGGVARLDFHRAHHPPCAHTPHATCPLPPLANRLSLAVTAGERNADP